MTNSIQMQISSGVACIKLNRPEVHNSFNREMAFALQKALDNCEANDEVRSIVISGNGHSFCAGQDLKEVTDDSINPGFQKILEEHYSPIIKKIRSIEKPILASVNGVAAGAGANIALACDIVVASENAIFIQAFSKIGLVPDSGGTYFLPRLIGFQRATSLMMLGDKLSAKDAFEMGLIYKVFAIDDFEKEVDKMANTLAHLPTKALGFTKRLLNHSLTNNLEQQLKLESTLQIEASKTCDYKEGVLSFFEKRKPKFNGN